MNGEVSGIVKSIVQRFQKDTLLIVLFGSHAYGKASKESDIDLYIVTKDNFIPSNWSQKSKINRVFYQKIEDLVTIYPIDLLIHTYPMHLKFLELNSSFAQEIMKKGKILWQTQLPKSGSKPLETI